MTHCPQGGVRQLCLHRVLWWYRMEQRELEQRQERHLLLRLKPDLPSEIWSSRCGLWRRHRKGRLRFGLARCLQPYRHLQGNVFHVGGHVVRRRILYWIWNDSSPTFAGHLKNAALKKLRIYFKKNCHISVMFKILWNRSDFEIHADYLIVYGAVFFSCLKRDEPSRSCSYTAQIRV